MVFKGNLDIDKRGMIYESYRMDGIVIEECRVIFLDWAMNSPQGDLKVQLQTLLDEYSGDHPDHPMTSVITDGLKSAAPKLGRRGGRMARHAP